MHRVLLRNLLVSVLVIVAAACGRGGSSSELTETACTTKGEHQRTGEEGPSGTEWECYELVDGSLVWRVWEPEGYPDQVESQITDAKPDTNQDVDLVGTTCDSRGQHVNNATGTIEYECYFNPDGSLAWQVFLDARVDPRPMKLHWGDGICDEREANIQYALTPNLDDIALMLPLGILSSKHVTPVSHSYIQFKKTSVAANDIIAQADGYIVRIEGMPGDYGMVIQYSCDLYGQYGHLDELAGPVAELNGQQIGYGKGTPEMRVPVKAGELVGRAGEIRTDWQMSDQGVTLPNLQPLNYVRQDFWKVHSVSALDYLPADIKTALSTKLMRQSNPRVGKIDYDIAGTASGAWFVEGTCYYIGRCEDYDMPYVDFSDQRGYWDTHMSIVPAALDPSVTLIGKGLVTSKGAAVLAFRDTLDPSTIKFGDAPRVFELVDYSYESPDGKVWDPNDQSVPFFSSVKVVKGSSVTAVLVLQVTGDQTLKAELRVGPTASMKPEFTSAVQKFER